MWLYVLSVWNSFLICRQKKSVAIRNNIAYCIYSTMVFKIQHISVKLRKLIWNERINFIDYISMHHRIQYCPWNTPMGGAMWIDITMDITVSSVFLSQAPSDPKKYPVPVKGLWIIYRWLNAKQTWLHCEHTGVTPLLHWPIDMKTDRIYPQGIKNTST